MSARMWGAFVVGEGGGGGGPHTYLGSCMGGALTADHGVGVLQGKGWGVGDSGATAFFKDGGSGTQGPLLSKWLHIAKL